MIKHSKTYPINKAELMYQNQSIESVVAQWQLGDWGKLTTLGLSASEDSLNSGIAAVFIASAFLQDGAEHEARKYLKIAQRLGVDKGFIEKILIAGVFISLGRAFISIGQISKAEKYFTDAVRIVFPSINTDSILVTFLQNQALNLSGSKSFLTNHNSVDSRLIFLESFMAELEKEKKVLEKQKSSKYFCREGYDEKRYWDDRHAKYDLDFSGVGNKGLSNEQNRASYYAGLKVFNELCSEHVIDFSKIRVLDIGCGNGFYANFFYEAKVSTYHGVDISDVLLDKISAKYPGFTFQQLDVGKETIKGVYDLIIMIDVTQHIVNEAYFSSSMQNVKKSLANNGTFIVTSWLNSEYKNSFYEISRGIESYRREFVGWKFSRPRRFRDKYIFSIMKDDQSFISI